MRLKEICRQIGLDCNIEDIEISSLATLSSAKADELSFFDNPKYMKDLKNTKAGAVILEEKYLKFLPKNTIALLTDEPYLKFALTTKLFAPKISAKSTPPKLGKDVEIASTVSFGRDVEIGDGSIIMAGSYIGDRVKVGKNTLIYPNVTIYYGCSIGDNNIIHSGAVIGSDGYGFAHTKDGRHIKIYQLGAVRLGDNVEIGANTTIDRGAIGDTIIGSGTKIDNQVQIGHNCELGENCLIVAQTGIAGSSKLGRNVVMGGQSATAGHLEIGDFATLAARAGATKSLDGGKVYAGLPAMDIKLWRRQQAILMRLAKEKKSK